MRRRLFHREGSLHHPATSITGTPASAGCKESLHTGRITPAPRLRGRDARARDVSDTSDYLAGAPSRPSSIR